MTTLSARLQRAFDPHRHKQAEMARAAGVKQPSVAAWFSGETVSLKAVPLVRAAKYLGVNALWLATGEGRMRDESHVPVEPFRVTEPPASYGWPFRQIDRAAVEALPLETRLMLEGALLLTAQQFGLDLRHKG